MYICMEVLHPCYPKALPDALYLRITKFNYKLWSSVYPASAVYRQLDQVFQGDTPLLCW
jgi:hypothetical protein